MYIFLRQTLLALQVCYTEMVLCKFSASGLMARRCFGSGEYTQCHLRAKLLSYTILKFQADKGKLQDWYAPT